MNNIDISIIIPFHTEKREQLNIVLSSINNQIGFDFNRLEVILIGDGGTFLEDGAKTFYLLNKLNIKYKHFNESGGPGVARQRGIEIANGKYFMFFDADDQFQTALSLLDFFEAIDEDTFDIVIGKFVEQVKKDDGSYFYVFYPTSNNSSTHAKLFNKAFLNEFSINWPKDLTRFEDTYFVSTSLQLARNIKKIESVSYMWMWNPNSLGRTGIPGISFDNELEQWIRGRVYFFDKLSEFRPEDLLPSFNWFMADLFYRTKKFKPIHPGEFQIELVNLMKQYGALWNLGRKNIEHRVQNLNNSSDYENISNEDFPEYLTKIDSLANLYGGTK